MGQNDKIREAAEKICNFEEWRHDYEEEITRIMGIMEKCFQGIIDGDVDDYLQKHG